MTHCQGAALVVLKGPWFIWHESWLQSLSVTEEKRKRQGAGIQTRQSDLGGNKVTDLIPCGIDGEQWWTNLRVQFSSMFFRTNIKIYHVSSLYCDFICYFHHFTYNLPPYFLHHQLNVSEISDYSLQIPFSQNCPSPPTYFLHYEYVHFHVLWLSEFAVLSKVEQSHFLKLSFTTSSL
jgi:hypothetical protein